MSGVCPYEQKHSARLSKISRSCNGVSWALQYVPYLFVVAEFGRVDEHAHHQEIGLRAFPKVHKVDLSVVVSGAGLFYIFSYIANRHDRIFRIRIRE